MHAQCYSGLKLGIEGLHGITLTKNILKYIAIAINIILHHLRRQVHQSNPVLSYYNNWSIGFNLFITRWNYVCKKMYTYFSGVDMRMWAYWYHETLCMSVWNSVSGMSTISWFSIIQTISAIYFWFIIGMYLSSASSPQIAKFEINIKPLCSMAILVTLYMRKERILCASHDALLLMWYFVQVVMCCDIPEFSKPFFGLLTADCQIWNKY